MIKSHKKSVRDGMPKARQGQYLTMTICGPVDDPGMRGHWSSPAHVRWHIDKEVAKERERIGALLAAIRVHWIKANGEDSLSVGALDVIAEVIADGSYVELVIKPQPAKTPAPRLDASHPLPHHVEGAAGSTIEHQKHPWAP